MPDAKKALRAGIFFLLTAFAAYIIILISLANIRLGGHKLIYRVVQGLVWKDGYSYERFQNYDKSDNYDILVFGSSRANRGFDPRVFEESGLTMYNLGTDDQTPINTAVLVKEYVNPRNCRLVIIDLYDQVFAARHVESTADLIQNLKDDGAAWDMALASRDIRAINQFGARAVLKFKEPEYLPETSLYNGFRESNEVFRYSPRNYIYRKNPRQLKALDETLSYLKTIGMPCIVVCQPLPDIPRRHQEFVADVEKVLVSYDQPLYDFTSLNVLDSVKYFADMSHLNGEGARKYSAFILDSLVGKTLEPEDLAFRQ